MAAPQQRSGNIQAEAVRILFLENQPVPLGSIFTTIRKNSWIALSK
jgi:hypothetical protein